MGRWRIAGRTAFLPPALLAASWGASFHVDPERGSMANAGTAAAPWNTLQAVFDANRIESRKPAAYPYAGAYSGGALTARNAGAPVKAGDTLVLHSGYHGKFFASEYYNAAFITILAAPGQTPRFASFELRSVSRWRVKGLSISPSHAPAYQKAQLFAFSSHGHTGPSSDCVVEGCTLFSVADTKAWTKDDWNNLSCNGIELSGPRMAALGNRLKNVNFGIGAGGDSALVERNVVENFAGDGLRGLGNHQVFQYNTVKNCYAVNANHDDGFQSWSVGPGGVGTGEVVGMTLRGNTIINYEDPNQPFRGTLQGIGCFDGMFRGWVVENNVVITDHWHGITLLGAVDSRIVNNTVIDQNSASPGPPWISIDDHKDGTAPRNCLVANNISASLALGSGVASRNNVALPFAQYGTCFVNASAFDLHLKAGCPAIGAADAGLSPALDRDALARPQGGTADAGAYEFPSPGAAVKPAFSRFSRSAAAAAGPARNALGRRLESRRSRPGATSTLRFDAPKR